MLITLLNIVDLFIRYYSYLLVAYALMSWFPGAYETTIGKIVIKWTEPYLDFFKRFNLVIGPIDFTVLVAIVILQVVGGGFHNFVTMFI